MDTWHGVLLSAIAALAGAVTALWRENRRLHEQQRADLKSTLDASNRLGLAVAERLPRRSENSATGLTHSPPR